MTQRAGQPPPPLDIIAQFHAAAEPQPLPGGQGAAFRLGDIVLKRCDDPDQTEWLFRVLESVDECGFRIARPIRARTGSFVVDGWCAMRWLAGEPSLENRWHDAIDALQAFHRAVANVPFSPVLQRSSKTEGGQPPVYVAPFRGPLRFSA
jgi:hypothetical protein